MNSYKVCIECVCTEHVLIDVFNFIDAAFYKEHRFHVKQGDMPSFKFRLQKFDGKLQQSTSSTSEMEHFLNLNQNELEQTQISLTIAIENDADLDVFTYRYLFLIINKLLRKQDQVSLDCPDSYYHKVGSYFFFQTLSQASVEIRRRGTDGRTKKLPQSFSLSSEWLPAIYLPNSRESYTVLANPLFNGNIEELKRILQTSQEKADRLNFKQYLRLWEKPPQERYAFCLERYFESWLNGMLSEIEIAERLYSTPGISQLLFALLCRKMLGRGEHLCQRDAEKLLEICCDLGDCILQVAENIVSHTEGGVLSVRINDNWDKIREIFEVKNPGSARWYMRISLVDFSRNSILDNVTTKSKIDKLTLSHIFMEEKAPEGIRQEDYQRVADAYEQYLNGAEHIIHHYGLEVFRNVVNQYKGCFTVKSSANDTIKTTEWYVPDSESIIYNGIEQNCPHIPGTEYDILIPIDDSLLDGQRQSSNPSVLLNPKYIVPPASREVVFEEELSEYFNRPLSDVVREAMGTGTSGYQQMKEQVVSRSAENLAEKLRAMDPEKIKKGVLYFYLTDIAERVFGRAEIVAKVILQVIAKLKESTDWWKDGQECLYLVLYGLSEGMLMQFTRQFALFYRRSTGNRLMQGCRLYVVSENYQAEVMFAGVRLSIISDYCRSRQLVTGTSSRIAELLTHIADREDIAVEDQEKIEAFPFELLRRMERYQGKERVILSEHNKWYHKNLETVLQNDIHGKDLGCCLQNVHVRVGDVHLHTFFEGQLLFANLYWYQIFAHHICEEVLSDKDIDEGTDILLYGYETYSEQMLFAAAQKLRNNGRRVYYAVFENPKYITAAELSEQRVRYIDQLLEASVQKLCVIYIYGIGTTLATISRKMNAQLEQALQKNGKSELLGNAYKKGMVIIQVSNKSQSQCNCNDYTVSGEPNELDFLRDGKCSYLVEVQTEWYRTKDCPYCLQVKSYLDEEPLIQTNETSTVPMVLIKPEQEVVTKIKFKQEGNYTQSFLQNNDSAEYLYYSHLNRAGNHYQFYIRTAALLNDRLRNNDEDLAAWFQEIQTKEMLTTQEHKKARINIIVSPQHFSNESLVAAVNERVFKGEAYIINFDVKKEFRDSFVAKFQNYRSVLEMFRRDGVQAELELDFYFVDDIILTGSTFNRAKSLVSSMLGEFARTANGESFNISVNLFKGIILLVNRNSKQTMCNYFTLASMERDQNGYLQLPVYAFIELNTPAIRSYGDSCPICNKLVRIQTLEKESSLTYVERHWREKAAYHGLRKLSDAKSDKNKKDNKHCSDEFYRTRGLRRLQCSEAVWTLLKSGNMTRENAREILENEISGCLSRLSRLEEKVEYLISYLKIISREHVVFQEIIQPAAFQILLSLFSVFIESDGTPDTVLCQTVRTLIQDSEHPNLIFTLYQIIIARLCTMGSTVFCHRKQLEACLEKGLELEKRTSVEASQDEDSFSEFLCFQIKKMLFITPDCAVRVKKLQCVLEKCIQDEFKREGEEIAK